MTTVVKLASVNEDPAEAAPGAGGVAPLSNVALLDGLMTKLMTSAAHLPRMGVLSGPSGFGKSFAAAAASAKFRSYYIAARSTWTRRHFLGAVLREQGIAPAKTVPEMVDQVAEQLALSGRPLILDEADHVLERGLIEICRDIYEQSNAVLVFVGEEWWPSKIRKHERVHGRIQAWAQAQPCSLQDARSLSRHYAPGLEVRDDLLERLVDATFGSTRRVCVNLAAVAELARKARLASVGLLEWSDRPVHTGAPPAARAQLRTVG